VFESILLNKISGAVHVKILSYRTLRLHLTSVSQQVGVLSNYQAEVLVQAKVSYPRESKLKSLLRDDSESGEQL
jgi:hypothetical protein